MDINKKVFKTLEEVKEFINGPEAKNGAIRLLDENGKAIQLTMSEFVDRVGFDNAANFIFSNTEKMSTASLTKDEARELMKRFLENPDSLTQEEKVLIHLIGESLSKDDDFLNVSPDFNEAMVIITLIIKSIITVDSHYTKNVSSLTAILITILEQTLLSSTNLSAFKDSKIALEEVIKKVKNSIIIPEDIDDATLLLGLIHIIGDRCITNKDIGEIDYHELSKTLGLDMEFLFGEKEKNPIPKDEIDNLLKKDFEKALFSAVIEPNIRQILKEDIF